MQNIYITGTNSKNYLDESLFKKNNINHIVQKFDYDYFASQQNCIEPLSIIHQLAKIGYSKIKKKFRNFSSY